MKYNNMTLLQENNYLVQHFQVLGVDSEFCNVEALVTGLVDNWPQYLLKHRRLFTVGLSVFMFLCGIPMCTEVR